MKTHKIIAVLAVSGLAASVQAQCPMPGPQNLSASNGIYCGSVFLTWTNVEGAWAYDVYRNTTNNWNTAGWVGGNVNNQYTDATAAVGTTYYYWVTASRPLCLQGFPSNMDTGYRGQDPVAPTGVVATDGTECGGVKVTWTQPAAPLGGGVGTFTIYRNTSNVYLTSSAVGAVGAAAREYLDMSTVAGETYHYWVRAENDCGTAASDGDSGFESGLSAPANDACSGAIVVNAGANVVGNTTCATNDGGSACGQAGSPSRDVWYKFTAPAAGTLHVDTCGVTGSFDTVLSVHVNACPASAGTQYLCNDDSCGVLSSLDVPVTSGLTYLIRVAGKSANEKGSFGLHVGFTPSASCYANCDGSLSNPLLTANDFQCFLDKFASGNSYANCDGAGGLTANDFQCFLDRYAGGCS